MYRVEEEGRGREGSQGFGAEQLQERNLHLLRKRKLGRSTNLWVDGCQMPVREAGGDFENAVGYACLGLMGWVVWGRRLNNRPLACLARACRLACLQGLSRTLNE